MFTKYSSIENHYNSRFIEKIKTEIPAHINTWVAREKIHGTNFSFIVSNDNIIPCKRSGKIAEGESFFNYNLILDLYRDNLLKFGNDHRGRSFQIFGEFAGNGIQREVNYGDKDFYVFDIAEIDDAGTQKLLCDCDVVSICDFYGLKMAPLIEVGTLDELLELNNEFESTVLEYNLFANVDFNLYANIPNPLNYANNVKWPLLAVVDNCAEGLVIKPNIPCYLSNGSRVIIKSKNSKFSEKKQKQYKPKPMLSEHDNNIANQLFDYATEARISNVISKIGEVTSKDFGLVLGLTIRDIIEDANKDGIDISLAENDKLMKKELSNEVKKVMRSIWTNYL